LAKTAEEEEEAGDWLTVMDGPWAWVVQALGHLQGGGGHRGGLVQVVQGGVALAGHAGGHVALQGLALQGATAQR